MADLFPTLPTNVPIVIDTEGTGLSWKTDYIVGFVLTWGANLDQSQYYPIRHQPGGNLENSEQVVAYFKNLLQVQQHVIFHNAAFDLDFLCKEGIHVEGFVEDTMINEALIYELHRSVSLENCCLRRNLPVKKSTALYEYLASIFGGPAKKEQMSNYWKLRGDDPLGVEYARTDGVATYALWQDQQKYLDEDLKPRGDLRKVWMVESKLIKPLHEAKMRGVGVDEDKLEKVKNKVSVLTEKALKAVNNINVRSNKQVMQYIMENSDNRDWPLTAKKKNPSFPEAYLNTFSAGQAIIRVRELRTLLNTFIEPIIEKHIWNGRIHSSFAQTGQDEYGTVTGRLSSYDPNMQQISKRKVLIACLLRQIFITTIGAFRWYEADYNQAEYRLFAHFAKIKKLIDGYNEGTLDMHNFVVELVKVDRTMAKNINFGTLYGLGIPSFSKKFGVPIPRVKEIRRIMFENLPEANPYEKNSFSFKAEKRMKSRGFVTTVLGRRKHHEHGFAYRAMNYIIQGSSADVTKSKFVELSECFKTEFKNDAYLFFSVHDAIDWQYNPERPEIITRAKEIMEDFGEGSLIPLRVKLTTDGHEGDNWAEATFGPDYTKYLDEIEMQLAT